MGSQLVSATDGRLLWSFAVTPRAPMLEPDAMHELAASVERRLWANLQVPPTTDAALAVDPGYSDALVCLAESRLLMPLYGAVPPIQAIPRARRKGGLLELLDTP